MGSLECSGYEPRTLRDRPEPAHGDADDAQSGRGAAWLGSFKGFGFSFGFRDEGLVCDFPKPVLGGKHFAPAPESS